MAIFGSCQTPDDTITTGSTLKGALNALGDKAEDIEIYTVSANRRWLV